MQTTTHLPRSRNRQNFGLTAKRPKNRPMLDASGFGFRLRWIRTRPPVRV